jgi:hypothetical protein
MTVMQAFDMVVTAFAMGGAGIVIRGGKVTA